MAALAWQAASKCVQTDKADETSGDGQSGCDCAEREIDMCGNEVVRG